MPQPNTDHPARVDARRRACTFAARFICAVLACFLLAPATVLAQDANEDYTFARGLYKTGRYQQAATAFKSFLETHKEHPRAGVATLYYGLSLSNLGQYRESRSQFEEFARQYPESKNLPDATYRIGECSFYARDYQRAITELKSFRTKFPDHSLVNWAYLFEGQSQLALKEWVVAQRTFQTLADRKPEPQMTRDLEYGLGRSLEGQNQIGEAFKYYGKLAKDNDPVVSPRALSRMGSLYFKADDLKQAINTYGFIVNDFEKNSLAAPARLNIGLAYFRLKDYPQALNWLNKAKGEKANRPRADILHAVSLQKTSKYPEADKALDALFIEFQNNKQFAPEILYYRADGLRLSGRPDEAKQLFERVATDWGTSPFADDGLFFAADSAMQGKDYASAQRLLTTLNDRFPDHTYKSQTQLLLGRIAARGKGEPELRKALAEYQQALKVADNDRTRALTRYYLARTHQQLREHKEVLATTGSLISEIEQGKYDDLAGVIVLSSVSELALGKYTDASTTASRYINRFPTGDKLIDAREVKAIAEANQGKRPAADQELKAIDALNVDRAKAVAKRVAEVAWQRGDFAWSRDLFQRLTLDRDSELRPDGLSGVAWSEYELKNYANAAASFKELLRDHPNFKRIAEAPFMIGEAYREGGRTEEAITAYRKAFNMYLPAEAAPPQAEFRKPTKFSFEAGRQLARLLELRGEVDEADKVYERLTTLFPEASKLDEIIERWAFMHQDAQNFTRSDELFKSLIDKRPRSPLIYNARMVLAESDMIAGKLPEASAVFIELKDAPSAPQPIAEGAIYNLIAISNKVKDDAKVKAYVDEYLSRFKNGTFFDHVRFFQSEMLYRGKEYQQAEDILTNLRTRVTAPGVNDEEWHGLVWVDLAEVHYANKQYAKVREVAAEMLARPTAARYYYRMHEIVGRSYYREANFDAARESFRKVVIDGFGRRTPTAGKCQLRLGDTWLAQEKYSQALTEFMKAYTNYGGLPEIQAAGLLQAAGCEKALLRPTDATKSYKEVIEKFPNTPEAKIAQEKLQELQSAARP
ncbi:MAG: tetratricopeptide repeat protein [Planctomycetaceae bacterium]